MKVYPILLSGGSGSRMGSDRPKQFLELQGKAVLLHSLSSLLEHPLARPLVVVAHPAWMAETQRLVLEYALASGLVRDESEFRFVEGGPTRHQSTANGCEVILNLKDIDTSDVLLIHDAARPVLQQEELSRLIELFSDPQCKLASLASSVTETLFFVDPDTQTTTEPIDRSRAVSIKTPQAIRIAAWLRLSEALKNKAPDAFTDLLTFGHTGGLPGYLAEAAPGNLKLTHPSDLELLLRFL